MKILTVVGARPQFIKAAVVSRVIASLQQLTEIIVHTGQHYDKNMSDVFFKEMDIPKPKYNLGIGGGGHGAMTGRQLQSIETVLIEEKPDLVLVYGDTNSTLAGALAAAKLNIPIAHVEAGLRSFNMKMPEEINRILTDQISSFLFCPTETACINLNREGFNSKQCKVVNVGDVMYDAARYYYKKAKKPELLNLKGISNYILATIHRAENTNNPHNLSEIINGLNEVNKTIPVICPMHPRTKKLIDNYAIEVEFITLDPVSYFEMIWLIDHCTLVITDSGGLQKEAYFFRKFCVTVRDETEWVELIDSGVNSLVGANKTNIVESVNVFMQSQFSAPKILYGMGDAGEKIVDVIMGL